MINQACERTKVISQDSDAPGTKRLCYVGMDNYDAGRMTGKLVKEAMPQGGTVIILLGRVEQDNAKRRRQGVIDEVLHRPADPRRYDRPGRGLRGPQHTVLGTLTDRLGRAKATANA